MTYFGTTSLKDSANLDAFARLRVSNPNTLFDSKQLYDSQPLRWDDAAVSGAGTSTSHSTATATTTIGVSNLTAGNRTRQTKRRFNYQPGKSQLVMLTGVFGSGAAGITKQIGYFDDNNGLFFGYSGTTFGVTRRTSVTGSPVDNTVAKASWNIDVMDGTGPSGVTLDLTKTQIMIIDFEWLGVGRVRMGFVVNGKIYYCHEFLNSNVLTTVFMSTPNLPLRYSISNDGSGPAATLGHICTTVMSEGGEDNLGLAFSTTGGNTHLDANTAGTLYAAIGLQLKTTHLSSTVVLDSISTLGSTTNDNFMWQVLLNPTVAGVFTYSDISTSSCQRALGGTTNTVTGGTLLDCGFVASGNSSAHQAPSTLALGSTISGTRDTIVLCIMPVGSAANLDVYTAISWRELV